MPYFDDVNPDNPAGQCEILNRLHADEIRAAMQYANHQVAVKGATCVQDAELFKTHYEEELGHAEKLRKAIDWLGGDVDNSLEEMTLIGPGAMAGKGDILISPDRNIMMTLDLDGERSAIEAYTEAFYLFLPRNPMLAKIMQENLSDEYEHRRELENLLS